MRMGYLILLIATVLLVAMFPNSSDAVLYVAFGFAGLVAFSLLLGSMNSGRVRRSAVRRDRASRGGEGGFFTTFFVLMAGAILGALFSTPVNKGMCLYVSTLWCQETPIDPQSDD